MRRRLDGWTVTGGPDSRGRQTPRLPDGSPNWNLSAHEPDNSPRAIAGRLLVVGSLYASMAAIFGAGFWLVHQPPVAAAITALVLSMPGPGPIWQALEVLAVTAATITAAGAARHLRRSRPASLTVRVQVEVLPVGPDLTIPAGQLVFRRFDSPALTAPATRPALRDDGGVEVETLLFGVVPSFLLLVALITAATGTEHLRQTVWPLLAGALLLAWLGRHLRRSNDPTAVPGDVPAGLGGPPWCESCGRAPGSVRVTFRDAVTFHICALCLAGLHADDQVGLDPQAPLSGAPRPGSRPGVQR